MLLMKENDNTMKVKMIATIILICICLFGGCTYKDRYVESETEGEYFVSRINGNSKFYDTQRYFYPTYNRIYEYDFKTGQSKMIYQEDTSPIYDSVAWNDWIFYVVSEGNDYQIMKYDTVSQEREEIFTDNINMELAIAHDYLLFKSGIYCVNICPIAGEIRQESINVNSLFTSDDFSGEEQSILYEGLHIARYYDAETEKYVISEVRDCDTGEDLFGNDAEIIMSDRCSVNFYSEYNDGMKKFYYQDTNGNRGVINCLSDEKYELSDIFTELLTEDQGKVIGLVSVSTHPLEKRASFQEYVKNDILFELDPKTGENRIIYDTQNNLNRIIGYQDGIVYLFGNQTVYSISMENNEKRELFTLETGGNYIFDWYNGYLIVRYGDEPYDVIQAWSIYESHDDMTNGIS